MVNKFKNMQKNKILFFSYNYFPEKSPGAIRAKLIAEKFIEIDQDCEVTIFTTQPRRYGLKNFYRDLLINEGLKEIKNIKVKRFWIPYLGLSPLANLIAYIFYFAQAFVSSFFVRPTIILATSAKLMTAFLATISSKINNGKLFIDLRDPFTDAFLNYYRWKKRIIFLNLFIFFENIIFRSAYSINFVSLGFISSFYGFDRFLKTDKTIITNFTNGLSPAYRQSINKAFKIKKIQKTNFRIIYAGNLGKAQDIITLLKALNQDNKVLLKMYDERIKFEIYGSGIQLKLINEILNSGDKKNKNLISKVVSYKGLVSSDQILDIYASADCLLLNLGKYISLSTVIPSKIFEYSATPLPIIFDANGYTKEFIKKINGTILFNQLDPKDLFKAIKKAKKTFVNKIKRDSFLDLYDSDKIYKSYAKQILNK